MFSSLRARLLAVSSLVMVLFTALAVGVLDNAFERTARNSVREQLNAQLYALLTAAEMGAEGNLYFPERLAEPRFAVAGSGLYAFVYDSAGDLMWQSASAVSAAAPATLTLPVGSMRFATEGGAQGVPRFELGFGVAWEIGDDVKAFTFVVVEDPDRYRAQVGAFRRSLFFWSGLGIAVLLALQLAILHWAMRPLGAVSREIRKIEDGQQHVVEGDYPAEIAGLTRNINRLIESSQRATDRYRNSLGDLAHSLKTPLAVLRGLVEEDVDAEVMRNTLKEQSLRMGDIVERQLKRAASSGGGRGGWSDLRQVTDRLTATLGKVYADRRLSFDIEIDASLRIPMDSADLMEVLGNVLENACKWSSGRIEVTAERDPGRVAIHVSDDGPGIDPELAEEVLQRGVRADQQVPGQGIGLAVARDVLDSYHGEIRIGRSSSTGGARVSMIIDTRSPFS